MMVVTIYCTQCPRAFRAHADLAENYAVYPCGGCGAVMVASEPQPVSVLREPLRREQ